ncbi:hypothetical protein MRX96_018224 [Rhipicephalus microplus]
MAIDGDATPTDEDGTSEASRLGMIHPPSGEPVGNEKGPVESVKHDGSELATIAPSGGFLPLPAPPGLPGQFGNHGLLAKDKVDANSVKEPKSPVAVSSHEAASTDVKTEKPEKTDLEKMQQDEQSSGQQAAEPGQEVCAFDPSVSSVIPLPVGLPGMPSQPVPPRPFGNAPVRFSGPPPMFPFENPADGRPVGDFCPPNPHDQAIMGGPGEQRMMGGPLEQHMLDGPPEANMMGGLMEHRMHRGPEPRMMGGPLMGGPPEPRMMGGPEELRMLGGPPEHRMMGGPRDHRMMGGPMQEPRMMGGPPDHRMMGGPPPHHRMMGGPPPGHRMMGGPPPDHRMMGGPPDHRLIGGPPPDHRMMGGPP